MNIWISNPFQFIGNVNKTYKFRCFFLFFALLCVYLLSACSSPCQFSFGIWNSYCLLFCLQLNIGFSLYAEQKKINTTTTVTCYWRTFIIYYDICNGINGFGEQITHLEIELTVAYVFRCGKPSKGGEREKKKAANHFHILC